MGIAKLDSISPHLTMASRLARSAAGAARLRPAFSPRTLPALTTSLTSYRSSSTVPAEDPKKKAQSILDSLPGNSLISKTAILSSSAGAAIYAISNEYYVVNEETVVEHLGCRVQVWWTNVQGVGGWTGQQDQGHPERRSCRPHRGRQDQN